MGEDILLLYVHKVKSCKVRKCKECTGKDQMFNETTTLMLKKSKTQQFFLPPLNNTFS